LGLLLFLLLLPAPRGLRAQQASQTHLQFVVHFDTSLQALPYSGRVYVMLNRDPDREPRLSRSWFAPPPVFAVDVDSVSPHHAVLLDSTALYHPVKMTELPTGTYAAQAVARRSPDSPVPGKGAGDLYSEPVTLTLPPEKSKPVALYLDRVVEEEPFPETASVKLVEMVSPALSAFHGRKVKLRAAVSLPPAWHANDGRDFPIVYYITGFGGSHRSIFRTLNMIGELAKHVIFVVPDATNYHGHSVFADSENSGPWGHALTAELIPFIEKKYRAEQRAQHRYVTGISSGGWSSLWLQITYPDSFNGCWSIVPDPVDFRDFLRIDLYAPGANVYRDPAGNRRPLARHNGSVLLYFDDFVHLETVLGPGGQIHSFEAVFGARDKSGKPAQLFDRRTGVVDPEVAKQWQRYDINLILRENWQALRPKLAGKLHIFAGEKDTFYLDGAVRLLKQTLAELGSDADVHIIEGMAHAAPPGVFEKMLQQIQTNRRTR